MSFASRLSRAPIPYETAHLAEIADRYGGQPPELRELLQGAAGCSPYLAGLIQREADWLDGALAAGPEAAMATLLTEAGALAPAEAATGLRRTKGRVALVVALADLGGVWRLEEVTGALSAFADRAVGIVLDAQLAAEIARGRVPGLAPGTPPSEAGMFVIAMGKMGAGELNYSSDIDLICLFDETHYGEEAAEARSAFVRVTRRLTAVLSDVTSDGYVFRADLRLRPDASVTPVCISAGAAEQYYEAQGRTWERAAYIKARIAAGDIAAGEAFLRVMTPFVWRRHLDFAAIQDAHDMRLRIRDHKGLHGPVTLAGHNLKLGVGGIREIEFFTQTRQLIAGGRDPDLRARQTVGALEALSEKGWVPEDSASALIADYRAHREIEHRLQMVNDAQTHSLPATEDGFDRIARMCGEGDTAAFKRDLEERLNRVATLTEGFFNPAVRATAAPIPREVQDVIDGWRSYPALRSERAVAIFKRLQPEILARLGRAASPSEALNQFDTFLAGLPAGVQLFALFDANPQLVDLIVDICASAPALAGYLSRHARVFDAVIGGEFFTPWPGAAGLAAALAQRLSGIPDYERRLDAARDWAREWHFRVGVHHLRGLIDADAAGREYADLAGAIVTAIWPICLEEFARKHGRAPGAGAIVLAMGSLGAERLNAASDLDLIVIYEAEGEAFSDGPRPLAARTYYARLTQTLVTALSAPMAAGKLYDVDMRLRPSGRQGPVAVSLASFRDYQTNEAWTWEHLALTRARPLAGEAVLLEKVEAVRREVLSAKQGNPAIASDTAAMRERIFSGKPPDGPWDAKTGPGRLQDIELLAQSFALRTADPARRTEAQLRAGERAGLVGKADAETLRSVYRFLWRLHAGGRLLTEGALDMTTVGEGGQAFLLREAGAGDIAGLASRLQEGTEAAARIVAGCLADAGR